MTSRDSLRAACIDGDLNTVKSLIGKHDLDVECDYLYLAALHGRKEIVEFLIEYGVDVNIKLTGHRHDSALHAAIASRHVNVIRFLVEKGADVNIVDRYHGRTSLILAAESYGYWEMMSFLIEHGARVNAVDNYGYTPLMLASIHKHWEIVPLLIQLGANTGPTLFKAVEMGRFDIIETLVLKGANVNVRHASSVTLLMKAVAKGEFNTVSFLIRHGADVKLKDNSSGTALHFVRHGKVDKIIELLVTNGVNIDEEDNRKCTPLQIALHRALPFDYLDYNSVPCIFVEHGADITRMSPFEGAILVCCCILTEHFELALSIVKAGIHIGVVNRTDINPLVLASEKGYESLVEALILAGVNVNIVNCRGCTALHKAADENHIQCGVLLAEAGADIQIKNYDYGQTALFFASKAFKQAIHMTLSFTTKKTVCVIGNACSGKSTLIASLQNENESFFNKFKHRLFGVEDIRNRTAGIDPISVTSRKYGNVVFFDFAGQHEYHGPHEMFMESLFNQRGSTVTIIVVAKATEEESVITQQLERWLYPLRKLSSSSTNPIQVIVAGSFMDKVKSKSIAKDKLENCYQSLKKSYSDIPATFQGLCLLNCRQPYSSGFADLCQYLQEVPVLQVQANTTYSLCWVISQMKSLIVNDKALRLSSFAKWIDDNKENLPKNIPLADDVCKDLSSTGHYLYLPNKEEPLNSWLVLDLPAILHEVYGTLFSPSKKIVNEFGLLSIQELGNLFSTLDVGMIRDVLIATDFCIEVDPVILKEEILKLTSDTSECHDFLFFPALVSSERPKVFDNTQPDQLCHILCWHFQANPNHFISPRLMQTIILRLSSLHVFHCADTRQHYCSVWWNGLSWPTLAGVVIAIQISNNAVIQVIGRSTTDPKELCQYLSQITRDIKSTIAQINPSLSGCSYIIHGVDPEILLSNPSSPSPHEMYPLSIVLESTRTGKTSCFSSKPSSGQASVKGISEIFCGTCPSEDIVKKMYYVNQAREERTLPSGDLPTGHTHPPTDDQPTEYIHPSNGDPPTGHTHPPTGDPPTRHTRLPTEDLLNEHPQPKSLDTSPTDAELLKVLDRIPWWFDLAVGLGVSLDHVKYFRYSPTGGLDALCYWRDGHSGKQFPTSWKFLLDTIAEHQGTTVADKIRKAFFHNQLMTGVKRSIDPLSIPLVADVSQTSGHSTALKRDKSLTVSALFRLVSKKMCSKWYVFGVHLGVERSLMDTVRKDCGGEVKGCFLEVTERWLSGEDDTGDLPRTWETVFDALKQTGFPLLVREVKEQLSEEQSFTEAEV